MQPSKIVGRFNIATALLILLSIASAPALAQTPECPDPETHSVTGGKFIPLRAGPDADERFFLLEQLEEFYQIMLSYDDEPLRFSAALPQLKHEADHWAQAVKDRNIDPKLTELYADVPIVVKALTEYSAHAMEANHDAVAQKEERLEESDAVAGKIIAHALITHGLSLVPDVLGLAKRSEARIEGKHPQALAEARRKFESSLSVCTAHAESTAIAMTEKYQWQKGEAGFDGGEHQLHLRLAKLIPARDYPSARTIVKAELDRRPRNFQLKLLWCKLAMIAPGVTPKEWGELVQSSLDAASLVPDGLLYDDYRGQCAVLAAHATLSKSEAERAASPPNSEPWRDDAADALLQIETAIHYFSPAQDSAGDLRMFRAKCLATMGRFKDASAQLVEIADLKKTNPEYLYLVACVAGNLGNFEASLDAFRSAIKNGHFDPVRLRYDGNLAALRTAKPKEFNEATRLMFEEPCSVAAHKNVKSHSFRLSSPQQIQVTVEGVRNAAKGFTVHVIDESEWQNLEGRKPFKEYSDLGGSRIMQLDKTADLKAGTYLVVVVNSQNVINEMTVKIRVELEP